MKTDREGRSICPPGQEQYESFSIRLNGRAQLGVQYDYRTFDGVLFSCVAISLESARARRDAYLAQRDGLTKAIHHRDGDPSNNELSNLEVIDIKQKNAD